MQNIIKPVSKLWIGIDQCCSAVHSILIFLHYSVKNFPPDPWGFSLFLTLSLHNFPGRRGRLSTQPELLQSDISSYVPDNDGHWADFLNIQGETSRL